VSPSKLVPIEPQHEQQAVDALTKVFLRLLARDAGQSF